MQPVPDEHPSRPRATDPPRQQVTHTVPVPVHEHLVAPEAPPHYFVGRANEVKELAARLAAGKPVAIQGMGGIGKTALAQRLVQEVQGQFAGGVLWTTFLTPDTLQEPPTSSASSISGRRRLGVPLWAVPISRPAQTE